MLLYLFGQVFPFSQVMKHDLEALGYVLEYGKINTQDYLLPQRRNRVYATADVSTGQDGNDYSKRMKDTMEDLASDANISLDQICDLSLPPEWLSTERQNDKLRQALEHACLKSGSQNVFIDGSTSNSREAEYAVGVLTCVRPSHSIFSQKLQRWITVEEMWNAQGLFKVNMANPAAVDKMLASPKDAQDMAGNAFSSTCVQAKVLASMIHSDGWGSMSKVSDGESDQDVKLKACSSSLTLNESLELSDSLPHANAANDLVSDCDSDGTDDRHAHSGAKLKSAADDIRSDGVKRKFDNHDQAPHAQLHWSQLPVKRRAVGKTKAIAVADVTEPTAALRDQQVVPVDDHKAQIETLRQRNAKRKNTEPKQGDSAPKKKRSYVPKAKIAREGKKSVMSIWAKMELFKVLWQQSVDFVYI